MPAVPGEGALGVEDALRLLSEHEVRWVNLQFVDLVGFLRQVTVSTRLLDRSAFERGLGKLDGSSVRGFSDISESDLVLKPIPDTFAVVPWLEGTARFLNTIYSTGGAGRFPRDPRLALERAVDLAAREGYEAYMSAELEFFVFDALDVEVGDYSYSVTIYTEESSGRYPIAKKAAYYVTEPADVTHEFRVDLGNTLEESFRIPVEVTHHEVAAGGQIEVNVRYSDPLTAADRLVTVKYVARNVAAEHGFTAVFMPKPIPDDNGNGLHTHVSLWSGGRNVFYDPNDPYAELSETARHFIGGILEHARALAAITNPTVNSYRRLIPGYEAPVYLVWSKANRSAAIRVPFYHRGDERGRRIEFRSPDPTVNPYLAFAAIIAAGLDGVKRKLDPGDPVDENVYKMTPERRRQLGIRQLPRSLDEALDELESDNEWLKPVFGKEILETYIELKREEARKLAAHASPAEYAEYLLL